MFNGRVAILNHNRGMYGAELFDGSYSVFELLDSIEISPDDIISGPLDEEGGCTLNENEEFEAMLQNTGLGIDMAKKELSWRSMVL